jgi:hypothetical protein
MVIEYQITFQTGGFTITQRVDPNGPHGAQPVTTAPQTEGIAPPANRTKPQDGILMNRLPDTRHQVAAAHVAVGQLSRPAGDPSADSGHGGFNPGGDPSADSGHGGVNPGPVILFGPVVLCGDATGQFVALRDEVNGTNQKIATGQTSATGQTNATSQTTTADYGKPAPPVIPKALTPKEHAALPAARPTKGARPAKASALANK